MIYSLDLIKALLKSPEVRGTPVGIYGGFLELLDWTLGTITRITLTELAIKLNLSESVLRNKVKTLTGWGWIELVPTMTRGEYNLYVYAPYSDKPIPKAPPTPLFDLLQDDEENLDESESGVSYENHFGNRYGNRNESRNDEFQNEDSNIFININKKINKQRKEIAKEETSESLAVESVACPEEISGVEWESARKFVAQSIWERGTARDLVDLTTLALRRNWIDAEELKRIVRRADDNRRDYERTDGRIGKNCRWATIRERIAIVYGENGVLFPACDKRFPEPKPERNASRIPDAQDVPSDSHLSRTEEIRRLRQTLAGVSIDETAPVEATMRQIARLDCGKNGDGTPMNPIQLRCQATLLRMNRRRLRTLLQEEAKGELLCR